MLIIGRDGQLVAAGARSNEDRSARIWSLVNGELIQELHADGMVGNAQFSPDGQFILTAGGGKAARL